MENPADLLPLYEKVRRAILAGIESGVALWVNDIPPETAAERLRTAF